MPKFTPKKGDDGQPVWKDGKPVFVNAETAAEIEIDVDKLFDDNANLREEAKRYRTQKGDAETALEQAKLASKKWDGLDLDEVKAKLAKLDEMERNPPKAGDPSQQRIDELVAERSRVALGDKEAKIEALQGKIEATEALSARVLAAYRAQFRSRKITEALDKVPGLNPECRDDAQRRLEQEFEVEERTDAEDPTDLVLLMRDPAGKPMGGTDPTQPITPLERLNSLTRDEKRIWLTKAAGTPRLNAGDPNAVDLSKASVSDGLNSLFTQQAAT